MMKAGPVLVACLLSILLQSSGLAQSDELALKSQRAKEFMAEGKFTESIALYRQLNQAVPNNPGLKLNLGMALHMAGKERESVPQLEAAVKLDPTLTPAWLFLGAARLQLGKASAAVQALKTVLRLQPDHRDALTMLAATSFAMARGAEAAELYKKLADLDPESSTAWYGLGRSYESLSVRAFDALQQTAPESGYWLALMAEARLREQQFSSAFYLYRQAMKKMPTMRSMHAAVSEIYRQTGHPEWANLEEEKERQLPPPDCRTQTLECEFRAGNFGMVAFRQDSNSPEGYYWRSRAYNQLAVQAFTHLGQLTPSAEQHELKAHIYLGQKRYGEAADEWREALKLSPGDAQIQKQLGISLKFGQDYEGALAVFKDLVRQRPGSAELSYLLGDTLLDLQRTEEAIPLLRRAVQDDPQLLAAHKSLARAELAVGNAAAAIPHLKVALSSDDDGSLHYQLARAYQTNGQSQLAKQVLLDYQKIQKSSTATKEAARQDVDITPP